MKLLPLFTLLLLAGATLAAEKEEPKGLRALLQQGLFEEQANRDLEKASAAYEAVAARYENERALAATALFRLAEVRAAQGRPPEAIVLYQRVLAEFPADEALGKLSRERLAALGAAPAPAGDQAHPAAPTEAEASELADVAEIARNSPDLLNGRSKGESPLTRAATNGWLRVAEFLVAHGANPRGIPEEPPPLWTAASLGHKALVEFLLAHGADPNARTGPDQTTALIAAGNSGNLEVARVLLEHGADVHAVASGPSAGKTALLAACLTQHRELAALLLAHGADPNAVGAGLDPNGVSGGLTGRETETPLVAACQTGDADLAKLLLDRHADPNLPHGPRGETPLEAAVQRGSAPLVELLIGRGAKVNGVVVGALTALHLAADFPWRPELVELLLKHGALPNARIARYGLTPLHLSLASAAGHPDAGPDDFKRLRRVWEALLAAGVEINGADSAGDTLLHEAMRWEKLPADDAIWLIEHGADLESKNAQGDTPLDLAEGERLLAIEKRFVFPKAVQPRAVEVAVRLHPGEARRALQVVEPTADAPVTLADVLRHALIPQLADSPPAPSSNGPSLPSPQRPPAPARLRQIALTVPAALTAVVLRAGAPGEPLTEAARVEIDFKGSDRQGLQWPDLQPGEIVVLLARRDSGLNSLISSRELDAALTAFGYPGPAAAGAMEEMPFSIRAVSDTAQAGGLTLPLKHRDSSEFVPLELTSLLDDSALKSVALGPPGPRPSLEIQLTEEGAREFGAISKLYHGRRLGFIVGGQLVAAPVVQDTIVSGRLELAGDFTRTQARVWAAQLQASIAAGGFVTTPGKHHFFRGALTVSISVIEGGFLGWDLNSNGRAAGSGPQSKMSVDSGWFIFPESTSRIWLYEGDLTLQLVNFGEHGVSFDDYQPDSPKFREVPAPVAEHYRQALDRKHAN